MAKSKRFSKAEMWERSEMQGVKGREYEVAECYFDGFSITIVLGRDDSESKARPVQQGAALPSNYARRGKEDIVSGICIKCYFFHCNK